ncbi:MAG: YbaK/EbsC family protein [Ilumatobacteraceae bacterium]
MGSPLPAQRDIGIRPCPTTGVPPFGHSARLRVFVDPDLLQYDEVWAAAGTWHDVFGIKPHQFVEASEGLVADLKGC